MKSIAGKNVILTGATSGIGRCLALHLAGAGANLALCGRSDEKMAAVVAEIEPGGGSKRFTRTFCLSQEEKIVDFVQDAEATLGPIDILVNCAGVNSARAEVQDIQTADLDWMLTVNFKAPVAFMREVFQRMKPRKHGHIVNVLSTVCLFSNEGLGAYTASKAALDALTKVFRKEARAAHVKVTSVYPGGVNTPFRRAERQDYLSPSSVAKAICDVLTAADDVAVHELVLRPMVETNFS